MKQYWASLPTEEVGNHIIRKVEQYNQYLDTSGHFRLVQKAYRSYYGMSEKGFSAHDITRGGKSGELSKIKVNHLRSVLLTILNMATREAPTFIATAKGTDSESMSQQQFAEGLIDEYRREKGFGKATKTAAELALSTTEGWLVASWDETLGADVRPDESGSMLRSGDAVIKTKSCIDMIRDTTRQDDDLPWVIIHEQVNKWDLVKVYPALEEKILGAPSRDNKVKRLVVVGAKHDEGESDLVSTFELRHRVSASMENGRRVIILSDGTVLKDEHWQWNTVKAHPISPSPLHLTPMNYSPAFDLGAIQDALDIVYSSIVTNAKTFGVQNVWSKKGDGLTVTQLGSGLNHYQTTEGKPEGLNLTQIPPVLFNTIEMLKQDLQLNSGANSVSRGEPPTGVTAGNALALLASQAIQFNDGFQESIYTATEKAATDIIELIQTYATSDRPAYIRGKNRRSTYETYNADSVGRVVGFVIERVNPLLKTMAGRSEIAKDLLSNGMLKRPEQYVDFLTTGRIEALTDYQRTKYQHVQSENELLKKGIKPTIMVTDDPILHIQEHDSVLHSPEARENPAVVQATLEHLQEHGVAWNNLMMQYPEMMAALGIPPPPMMQPPPDDPTAMGNPQVTSTNPQEIPPQGESLETVDGQSIAMPPNPLTGQKFNSETGGM